MAPSLSVHHTLPYAAGRIGWECGALRVGGALDAPAPPRYAPRMTAMAFDTLAADGETLAAKADLAALEARLANRLLGAALAIVAAIAGLESLQAP